MRQLKTYSSVKIRWAVRFLWPKHFKSTEIHREISIVYGHTQCYVQPSWIGARCLMMIAQILSMLKGKEGQQQGAHQTWCSERERHHSQQLQSERSTHRVFEKLKEHLSRRQFSNNDQLQTAVLSWLQDQKGIFYHQDNEWLVEPPTVSAVIGRLSREIVSCMYVCHSVL